jgi:hypothetical protein
VTAERFAESFRADPSGAIEDFISGLGRMNQAGQSTSSVFKDLELNDERLKRALLSTAGAGELLTEQLTLGRQAWEDNSALTTEAEKRYATTAAQIEMLRNTVVDLGIDIGSTLLPAIRGAVEVLGTLALGLASMPDPVRAMTLGLGGAALAATGMVAGAAILIPKLKALQAALISMGTAGKFAAAAMPWLAAFAAAVGTASYVLGQNAKAAEEAEERTKGFTDAIREAGSVAAGTQAEIARLAQETPALAELMAETGTSVEEMSAALAASDAEFQTFIDNLKLEADAAGVSRGAIAQAAFGITAMRDAAIGGADGAAQLSRVLGDTSGAATGAAGGLDAVTTSAEEQAEATEVARKEFEGLLNAYRASIDPLFGMLDALDQNRNAQDALSAAIAANSDEIDDNNVSTAEMEALHRDVARSALDVEVASRELAAGVRDGTVSVEQASEMLAEWVAQGLITEEQAAKVAWMFGVAAARADEFAGDYVSNVYLVGMEKVNAQLDWLLARIQGLIDIGMGMSVDVLQAESQLMRRAGAATGGVVSRNMGPPQPSDTVPMMLTPGEGVVTTKGMSMLGPSGLAAINAGQMTAASSSASYQTITTDRSFNAPVTVIGNASRDQITEIPYRLKMLQLAVQSR